MALFELVSKHVKVRNVYYDLKSKEQRTKIIKPKYKLAGHPIEDLGQFVFFILTVSTDAYTKKILIEVRQSEWEERNKKYPQRLNGISHIDITKVEVLTSSQVTYKILDKKNRFKYIAKIPSSRFDYLKKKLLQLRSGKTPISKETDKLLTKALNADLPAIMKELGI